MIPVRIDIDKKTVQISHPEKLNELTADQYLKVVELFILNKIPLNTRTDDQIKLLYAFLGGFSKEKAQRKQAFRIIRILTDDERILDVVNLQNFLNEDQDFNNWLVPKIKIGKKIYYGPQDRFSTMSFGEFISADMYLSAYFGSKESEEILNTIVAILFREKRKDIKNGFTGDIREDFNTDYLQNRTNSLKEVDELTKMAVLYNFVGIRNWLTKKYQAVFSSPDTSSRTNIVFGRQESGWLGIRRHLAGSALNLEKTDKLNIHDVLSSLNEEIQKK